jgi:hypothetical protein
MARLSLPLLYTIRGQVRRLRDCYSEAVRRDEPEWEGRVLASRVLHDLEGEQLVIFEYAHGLIRSVLERPTGIENLHDPLQLGRVLLCIPAGNDTHNVNVAIIGPVFRYDRHDQCDYIALALRLRSLDTSGTQRQAGGHGD